MKNIQLNTGTPRNLDASCRRAKRVVAVRRSRLYRAYPAFTIVELLIVIVVIAILAAISIVAYTGIQDRARSAAATTSARQVSDKIGIYAVENEQYPASLSDINITNNGSTTYQYRVNNTSDPKTWCVTATVTNKSFYTSNTQGAPQEGACSGHGTGGVAVVTNLVVNPSPTNSYWFASSTGVASLSFVVADGVPAARSTRITTAAYALYGSRDGVALAQAGDTYTVQFTVKSSTDMTITFNVGYGNASAVISDINLSVSATSTAQTIRHTFTIPPSGSFIGQPIFPKFNMAVHPAGSWFEVSKVMWVKDEYNGLYADGNSPGWIWNGTPNNSTSTGPSL